MQGNTEREGYRPHRIEIVETLGTGTYRYICI